MNLGDLEFKAEDFEGMQYAATDLLTAVFALRVNDILREKLAKAPEVFGNILMRKEKAVFSLEERNSDTHSGLLVCIEEVGK